MRISKKIKILGINGSASRNSSNLSILRIIADKIKAECEMTIVEDLTVLPHFKTELTNENTPEEIVRFRDQVENSDGIIICSPEYVFSIPSGLKNAIEWCVSTTVFSDKPVGLITASANGEKGHEELQMIMRTIVTRFNDDTTLLIQGVRGKFNDQGAISDNKTRDDLAKFITKFKDLLS